MTSRNWFKIGGGLRKGSDLGRCVDPRYAEHVADTKTRASDAIRGLTMFEKSKRSNPDNCRAHWNGEAMKELEAISRKVEEWRELGPVARNGLQCADELESLLSALAERITELDEAFKIAKQQMALALKGRVDADLKRQLAEAQAQVAVVDRALHDLGDTSAQAALDAHDAEVRDRAVLDFTISALDYFSKKSTTGQQGERGIYARTYQKFGEFVNSEHPKLSANRNKVNS